MALGDGIRRNIAHVEPSERDLFRDALLELNRRFPGSRTDSPPGGVTYWFKQDEIHQATHVHGSPEFVPWHREIVNRFEELLREVNPQLSLLLGLDRGSEEHPQRQPRRRDNRDAEPIHAGLHGPWRHKPRANRPALAERFCPMAKRRVLCARCIA